MTPPRRGKPARAVRVSDTLTFPQAVAAVIEGRKVTRQEWRNDEICVYRTTVPDAGGRGPAGLYLALRKADGSIHALLVSDGDLDAVDWTLVREV